MPATPCVTLSITPVIAVAGIPDSAGIVTTRSAARHQGAGRVLARVVEPQRLRRPEQLPAGQRVVADDVHRQLGRARTVGDADRAVAAERCRRPAPTTAGPVAEFSDGEAGFAAAGRPTP